MNMRPAFYRFLIFAGLAAVCLIVAAVLYVCFAPGQPIVKYQLSDRNVSVGQTDSWKFQSDPSGGPPAGAEVFEGTWIVRHEADAPSSSNVLCQTASSRFPALALSEKIYGDVVVTTRFKSISGRVDQAAGIIFRVQDKDNYYILRANALEDNVNLYIYASGKRSSLKGSSVKVASNQWQTLRIEAIGNHFRGFLNDQLVVEATDDNYIAGRVGLWTKADSVTCFDEVKVVAK